jgi:uncharacterized membrane protein YqgA involved in biofilm formation
LAWQIAFLVIGSNPTQFRPVIITAIVEKFAYVGTLLLLRAQSRISQIDVQPVLPDLLLGVLFIVAFAKTRSEKPTA